MRTEFHKVYFLGVSSFIFIFDNRKCYKINFTFILFVNMPLFNHIIMITLQLLMMKTCTFHLLFGTLRNNCERQPNHEKQYCFSYYIDTKIMEL